MRSSCKDFETAHVKRSLHTNTPKCSTACDREFTPKTIESAIISSSKMISADSFLTHNPSAVSSHHPHSNKLPMSMSNATMNISAMVMSSSNNSESLPPPPSYSRLPPDGHEFPPDYKDPSTTCNSTVPRVRSNRVHVETLKM